MVLLFFVVRNACFILRSYHCVRSLSFVARLCSHLVMTSAHSLCYGRHCNVILPDSAKGCYSGGKVSVLKIWFRRGKHESKLVIIVFFVSSALPESLVLQHKKKTSLESMWLLWPLLTLLFALFQVLVQNFAVNNNLLRVFIVSVLVATVLLTL